MLNTPGEQRWIVWDDPGCEAGCALAKCNRGRSAPCCVKRLSVRWPVACAYLEHGCYSETSLWSRMGLVVVDRNVTR